MIHTCEFCGAEFKRRGSRKYRFCGRGCDAKAKRKERPSPGWLRERYIDERMPAPRIAEILSVDASTVLGWLRDAGVTTRKRGAESSPFTFRKGQVSLFKGRKHTEEYKQRVREKRLQDGHVPYLVNGVHYLKGKRGPEVHSWKGGVTPERQSFYAGVPWKTAVKAVWARANAKCERCGIHHNTRERRGTFHVHHVVSFAESVALRAEPSNLRLLCKECHLFVHSRANSGRELLAS